MLLIERDDGSLLSSDDGSLRDYFFMNKKNWLCQCNICVHTFFVMWKWKSEKRKGWIFYAHLTSNMQHFGCFFYKKKNWAKCPGSLIIWCAVWFIVFFGCPCCWCVPVLIKNRKGFRPVSFKWNTKKCIFLLDFYVGSFNSFLVL